MCMLRQGCSQSMLHRTCEKLHGGSWVGILLWGVRSNDRTLHAMMSTKNKPVRPLEKDSKRT